MVTNIEKYRTDLDRLIGTWSDLQNGIQYEFLRDETIAAVEKLEKDQSKLKEIFKKIPSFTENYQNWYSEAKSLIKQLLPDRLEDFIKLYEKPKSSRKSITFENYVIEDSLQWLTITEGYTKKKIVWPDAAIPKFRQQLLIIKSVKSRFETSLFDIATLVHADILDSEIDAAQELNNKWFFRAAGAVAWVVLEHHLQQVCDSHWVSIPKKNPCLSDLSQALKDSDVIDTPRWRQIQHLTDLRNLCDHKKTSEPTQEDMEKLIKWVSEITKNIF